MNVKGPKHFKLIIYKTFKE